MTPPKKPDWMEIADNDGGSIKPAPATKKSRPLLVAMAALTLTFGGAVVAQTSQENSGDAQQPLLVQASQSASVATPALSASNSNSISPAPADPRVGGTVQAPSIKNPSVKNGAVPAIGIPPSANGGDDDDDDEDDDDDRDDH